MATACATRTQTKYPTQNKQPEKKINYIELLQSATTEEGKLKEGYHAFYNFSLTNRLLACMQLKMMGLPITPIKTFNQWNNINRKVNKGSKALELCMPYINKYEVKNELGEVEEKKFARFVFKKLWFSMAQTSGEVYTPEVITWNKEKALKELNMKEVDFECINGNTQGYASINKNEIAINPLNKHYYSTLFHELAHKILLHGTETCKISHNMMEVEADCVAMLINATLELDDVAFNRGYIQNWIGNSTIDEKTAQRVICTTDKILKAGTV